MLKPTRDLPLGYLWVPRVFKAAVEYDLPWHRLCAMAIVLSNGDGQHRVLDHEYMNKKLSQDNPVYASFYDAAGNPSIDLIDRATKWGLFQLHGEMARQAGHKGRLIGLLDWEANIRTTCRILSDFLLYKKPNSFKDAERYFGVNPDLVDETWFEMKQEIQTLLNIPINLNDEDSLEGLF